MKRGNFIARSVPVVVVYAVCCILVGCGGQRELRLTLNQEAQLLKPTISAVQLRPDGEVDTGSGSKMIEVLVLGDPALEATFDVEGRIRGQAMREVSPGRYTGQFQVARGDEGALNVSARLRDRDSEAEAELRASPPLILVEATEPAVAKKECSPGAQDALARSLETAVIRFGHGKYSVATSDVKQLNSIIDTILMPRFEGCKVYVHGHADERGSQAFNLNLSRARALEVAWRLQEMGVDPTLIEIRYHGEFSPLQPGDTSSARAVNRRVEIKGVDVALASASN